MMEGMTDTPQRTQDEVAAALRAGRDLGPEYDDAVAASLVERIDGTIDERVRHHVAQHTKDTDRSGIPANTARFVLTLVFMGLSIPLTAIAGGTAGTVGVVALWLGLVVFYLVSVLGLRR